GEGKSLNGPGDGKTGADGRFSFPNATPGEWRITVVPPRGAGTFIQPPEMPVVGGTRDAIVRVQRLPEARARVLVDVVDAETGQPLDARDAYFFRAAHNWDGMPSPPEAKIERGRVVVDPVQPGDYVLWIGIEDRPQQLVRVHVDRDATRAAATVRVRRGVTLTGRVRAPEGFDGWPVGVSIEPVGRVPMPTRWDFATLTTYGRAEADADGAFRIEGRTATQYRVRVEKEGWLGETTVDASEGDVSIDLEIRRGTIVRFRGSDPIEIAYARVEGSMDGGPWTTISQIGVGEDHLIDDTETMTPGAWRWRVTFRKSFMSNDVVDAAEPQSGELLLEAGKDVEIVIPVVVRR
ncbi:MAG: hypothetical protein IT190_10730, partial [Microbacteriaceae bacterium]|nr:hypothetical protein [Microbacteriaceae bacterium]